MIFIDIGNIISTIQFYSPHPQSILILQTSPRPSSSERQKYVEGEWDKTVDLIMNSKKAKDTRTFGQDILLGTHIIRNVSKFFFTPPPKNSIQADEASIVIAGSIHETQFNKPRYSKF